VTISEYIEHQQKRTEAALDHWVPVESLDPSTIHRAMRYSLFAGGKRIRPLLAIAAAEAVADAPVGIESAACPLELIHTYSLIHDDLPALDNDDFRRGRPTCHKVFGDAMAILAGDALLTLAFEVLAKLENVDAERRIRLVAELATASGTVGGMIGGQVNDIEGEGKHPNAHLLESIHRAKTGALASAWAESTRAPTVDSSTPCPATESVWASHFRSSMTCWMWSSPPKPSARPQARMPSSTRSHSRRSTAWSDRERWRKKNGSRLISLLPASTIAASA
jgi:hypothetical protein